MGLLRNEALKKTLVAIVNDDCDKARELLLSGSYPKLRDLRTGQLLSSQDGKLKLQLESGSGTLLEVVE